MPIARYTDLDFAKLIGNIYAEVFQRRRQIIGTSIRKTANAADDFIIDGSFAYSVQHVSATLVFQWGPGGISDMVDSTSKHAGRYNECSWG